MGKIVFSYITERPPFIRSTSITCLLNASVCTINCTVLGHNGACEVYGLRREKDINQIISQINAIINCVKCYERKIPCGLRPFERGIGESLPEEMS